MRERREVDRFVTLKDQISGEGGDPVVLINTLNVDADDVDAFLEAWQKDAAFMKAQSGFISAQLHRGIAGSTTFLNYAVWQDMASFRAAFSNPEFQAKLGAYPDSVVAAPHLFQKVAIPNICVG